jgi:hypothetical protein
MYSDLARRYGAPQRDPTDDPEEQACDYAFLPNLPAGVGLMVFGDTVVRIDVDTTGVLTREGVGVGSSEGEVLERYAGKVRRDPRPYSGPESHYLVVNAPGDSTFRIIFETDGKRVDGYRLGRRDAVDLIEGCS